MTLKKKIKKHILWPGFDFVYRLNPKVALKIKVILWEIYNWRALYCLGTDDNDGNPRLIIDTTYTSRVNDRSGIQRVVFNVNSEIEKKGIEHVFSQIFSGKFLTCYLYNFLLKGEKFLGMEKHLKLNKEDKLLLLDPSWDKYSDFQKIINNIHKNRGICGAVIYDLFPIQYPEFFESDSGKKIFCTWHEMVMQQCDKIICISKATADIVHQYYMEHKLHNSVRGKLYYFHLGSKIQTVPSGKIRIQLKNLFESGIHVFLMVGTVEPRKGHEVACKAIEKILMEQKKIKLLIIGKDGWKNTEFVSKLKQKPIFGKNIVWINDASDTEVTYSYQHSDCLIAASKDEGFGLPLVEAAHYGLPIICSDIPIFHEVAEDNATYFKAMNSDELANTIEQWLQEEKHPDPKNIKLYSWADSAQEILDIMDDKVKPYKILQ